MIVSYTFFSDEKKVSRVLKMYPCFFCSEKKSIVFRSIYVGLLNKKMVVRGKDMGGL